MIISIAGFTESVIQQVVEFRGRQPILLIGGKELLQLLRSPELLANLLKAKQAELVAHGRVHLGLDTTTKTKRRPINDLPAASVSLLGDTPWSRCRTSPPTTASVNSSSSTNCPMWTG
ncbi:hypothetical protein [Streptomyces virginiae]|uniref:hypothetical protein n=1 Tax=Streptomyces virginiae TaxID=1961 RepID=UPI00177C4FAC|nr:hypothetical protein [Streptomyces virginiae]MBP2341905.1 hypothetical protein [Streptomyces virginiae]